MRIELGCEKYAELAKEAAFTPDFIAGGIQFDYLGSGISRIVLRGPDGIVYKVPKECGGDLQAKKELSLFDYVSDLGVPWAPDYWPYPNGVLAMREYRKYEGKACGCGYPECANLFRDEHLGIKEEMSLACEDVTPINVGLDDEGQPILLDGGIWELIKKDDLEARYSGEQ